MSALWWECVCGDKAEVISASTECKCGVGKGQWWLMPESQDDLDKARKVANTTTPAELEALGQLRIPGA